ncbi:Panacea domain-containing protein [Corynebacterium durum]|uniref:Panacea domain-containing protein n=1 Tax=Corynebacterium durum TaxID=61592 RepID=UPI00389B2A37
MDNITISADLDPMLVAAYFIAIDELREDADVTQLKLHKLLYFAQANYLASTGYRLFASDIEAFEHGPVVEEIRPHFKQYGRQIIVSADDAVAHNATQDAKELPLDVIEFLDAVWQRFGQLSASELRQISHDDAPWEKHYDPEQLHCVIPDREIQQWYRGDATADRQVYHPRIFRVTDTDLDNLDAPLSEEDLAQWITSA